MEFNTYLTKVAKKEFLKEGRLWSLLTCNVRGYVFNNASIEVYFDNGKSKELTDFPYSMEYLKKCHNCGYHIEHPSSQRKVKKPVHTIYVTSYSDSETTLTVRTTRESVYDYLLVQYRAIHHIPNRTITYDDKSIQVAGSSGIGKTTKNEVFENIIEYSQFEDEVTVTTQETK